MILKHKDIEIPADEPFKNCKLKRQNQAVALTSIISGYADGFVLSLNNPWGTGKTTFVKMWRAHLEKNGFTTLYFNAWENDYDSNPMVALMSELGALTNEKVDATFNSLIQKAAVLSHSVLPVLLKALVAKHVDSEVLKELLSNAGQGASDLLKEEITDYTKKKKGLVEFKIELEKFIREQANGKPLVIFIDELDRCRPNYAVEVLEQVKHFFSVTGIVFVLSIDKTQLGNAIRGFYGSELINSNEYLKRFIDLEFTLPEPSTGVFIEYLFEYFGFDEYFNHPERKQYPSLAHDRRDFISFSKLLFANNGLTLRQQEKLFSHARVVIRTLPRGHYLFPPVFILLIYLKDFNPELYRKLSARSVPVQSILDELVAMVPKNTTEENQYTYIIMEATLMLLYHNYYKEINYNSKIYEQDSQYNTKLLIKPHTDTGPDYRKFIAIVDDLKRGRSGGDVSLNIFLKKIDLLDQLQEN